MEVARFNKKRKTGKLVSKPYRKLLHGRSAETTRVCMCTPGDEGIKGNEWGVDEKK